MGAGYTGSIISFLTLVSPHWSSFTVGGQSQILLKEYLLRLQNEPVGTLSQMWDTQIVSIHLQLFKTFSVSI